MIPIREQREVVGHAVRAMYLYSAVADLAYELRDEELVAVCKTFWQDLCRSKLYITGGIGSDAENEGFTKNYDLPNLDSYAETCAAIALLQWAHRMVHLDLDSRYADVMERTLYNGVLAGLGIDGKTFFYHNPLASDGSQHRVSWPWWCPCCPANLARLILSIVRLPLFFGLQSDLRFINTFPARRTFPSTARRPPGRNLGFPVRRHCFDSIRERTRHSI